MIILLVFSISQTSYLMEFEVLPPVVYALDTLDTFAPWRSLLPGNLGKTYVGMNMVEP